MTSRDELLKLVEEALERHEGQTCSWNFRAKAALDERAAEVAALEKRRNCVHEWEPDHDLDGVAVFRCKHNCGALARLKLLAVDNEEGK